VTLTTYHHPVPLLRILGTLTSWKPLGLSRPATGLLYLYLYLTLYIPLCCTSYKAVIDHHQHIHLLCVYQTGYMATCFDNYVVTFTSLKYI